MDQLTPAQKTAVAKSSSCRLRIYLLKAGYQEEEVLAWTREELSCRDTWGPRAGSGCQNRGPRVWDGVLWARV